MQFKSLGIKSMLASLLKVAILFCIAWATATSAHAAHSNSSVTSRPFGLGAILGEPTGITGKYWMDHRAAIDGTLSFSFSHYFLIYSDYLYHFPGAFGHSSEFVSQLNPYIGVGLELLIQTEDTGRNDRHYFRSDDGSVGLAVRIPLGIEWRPVTAPIGVFVELAPGVGVIPATYGFLQGGVGIRFYF
jgi:hypothetical protein